MKFSQFPLQMSLTLACLFVLPVSSHGQQIPDKTSPKKHEPSAAYQWVEIMLEAAARDVERIGVNPRSCRGRWQFP